jgi:enoyl-CoA hydratase/carnithine racemase
MADVRIETEGGVTIVAFNRPEKKNAITEAMYGAVADALDAAAADDSVRAVILAGEGPDFTAGNDISTFAAVAAGATDLADSNVQRFLVAISGFPKPVVAAVTGRAIGVGVTMLLHCDLVYVAEDAMLTVPFVDLGVVPEAGSSRLLPARIGHVRAFALFALGETWSGADAVAAGLANKALPAADVLRAAQAAARTLAAKSVSSLRATKRLMRDADAIRAAIAADDEAFRAQLASPEAAAAFAAFAARKSKPE